MKKDSYNVDLNVFEMFYRICNSGGIAEASRRLRTPKATLSRKLSSLESALGAKLFDRKGGRLVITEAGEILYNHCEHILGEVERTVAHLSEINSQVRATLHVSLPPDIGVHWLASAIGEFSSAHPKTDIYADVTSRWVDLLEEPYDLSIHIGGTRQDDPPPTLVIAKLTRGFFASEKYLARKGEPKEIADLHEHDCIVHEAQRREGLWLISHARTEEKRQVRARVTVNSTATIRELVLSGGGIGILTEVTALRGKPQSLRRILKRSELPPLTVYASFMKLPDTPKKIHDFLNILSHHLSTK